MMKFLLATAAAMALTTGVASANDLSFKGSVEYAVEAETLEATAGVDYALGKLTLSPVITIADMTGDIAFGGLTVTAKYAVLETVSAYAKIETDGDLAYDEATLGVAFKF